MRLFLKTVSGEAFQTEVSGKLLSILWPLIRWKRTYCGRVCGGVCGNIALLSISQAIPAPLGLFREASCDPFLALLMKNDAPTHLTFFAVFLAFLLSPEIVRLKNDSNNDVNTPT